MRYSRFILIAMGLTCTLGMALAQVPAHTSVQQTHATNAHAAGNTQGGLHAHTHGPAHIYTVYRALREGGAVVFMRHAKTHALGKDTISADQVTDANCDQQRTLSPAGKETAREIGRAWGFLKLPPVEKVEFSPYCRTRETAELLFGANGFPMGVNRDLLSTQQGMAQLGEHLKKAFSQSPAPGSNRVLVGHLFSALQLGFRLEEGEALVAKPDGKGSYQIVGRITSVQWGDLTRDVLAHGDKVFELSALHSHGHGHGSHIRPAHEPQKKSH
jgi:phosphohistidine phosphatase SixA